MAFSDATFSLPGALPGLTDREAITDMVYRVSTAFDVADEELLRSAMTEDITFAIESFTVNGVDDIIAKSFGHVSMMTTTHLIGNVRVLHKEGESTAKVTATALAQHYREGEGLSGSDTRYLVGGLYAIDAVKDEKDGLWKARNWFLKPIWKEGDRSVMGRS
ncbi:hypothetical protein F5Y16DRAFT_38931 [Xylariaceae sp. FL0255]|nr:hypothetical protein F5Y16DRAFT_38931 [Xylariaceae sp. FL0255]